MGEFELAREGVNKLWIKTPFPVSMPVWETFVMYGIPFPRFSMIGEPEPGVPKPDFNSVQRWGKKNFHRYLNRTFYPDGTKGTAITDGEKGRYWTHADLPDDKRSGLNQAEWGLVYVGHPNQTHYIDCIVENMSGETDDKSRARILNSLFNAETRFVREAFDTLLRNQGMAHKLSRPVEIRNLAANTLPNYGSAARQYILQIPFGSIPEKGSLNTGYIPKAEESLHQRLTFGFFQNLDYCLDRSQTGVNGAMGLMEVRYSGFRYRERRTPE